MRGRLARTAKQTQRRQHRPRPHKPREFGGNLPQHARRAAINHTAANARYHTLHAYPIYHTAQHITTTAAASSSSSSTRTGISNNISSSISSLSRNRVHMWRSMSRNTSRHMCDNAKTKKVANTRSPTDQNNSRSGSSSNSVGGSADSADKHEDMEMLISEFHQKIQHAFKNYQPKKANDCLTQMRKQNLTIDTIRYNMVVYLLAESCIPPDNKAQNKAHDATPGTAEEAYQLLMQALSEGHELTGMTIDTLFQANLVCSKWDVVGEMLLLGMDGRIDLKLTDTLLQEIISGVYEHAESAGCSSYCEQVFLRERGEGGGDKLPTDCGLADQPKPDSAAAAARQVGGGKGGIFAIVDALADSCYHDKCQRLVEHKHQQRKHQQTKRHEQEYRNKIRMLAFKNNNSQHFEAVEAILQEMNEKGVAIDDFDQILRDLIQNNAHENKNKNNNNSSNRNRVQQQHSVAEQWFVRYATLPSSFCWFVSSSEAALDPLNRDLKNSTQAKEATHLAKLHHKQQQLPKQQQVHCSGRTYVSLLKAMQSIQDPRQRIQRMASWLTVFENSQNKPDAFVYNTFLRLSPSRQNQHPGLVFNSKKRAGTTFTDAVIARMRANGVAPDIFTYNSAIRDCVFRDRDALSKTREYCKQIQVDGLQMNYSSFSALLATYSERGEISLSEKVFETMLTSFPKQITATDYNNMARAGRKHGDIEHVARWLKQAKDRGFSVDRQGYLAAIKTCFNKRDWMQAVKWISYYSNSKVCVKRDVSVNLQHAMRHLTEREKHEDVVEAFNILFEQSQQSGGIGWMSVDLVNLLLENLFLLGKDGAAQDTALGMFGTDGLGLQANDRTIEIFTKHLGEAEARDLILEVQN